MGARFFLLLSAFAFILSGCGGSDGGGGSPSGAEALGAICSGASSSALRQAVYVAGQGTDDSGCGTSTASACKTLQQGIDNCSAPGCAVFVRHGLYPIGATIKLRDGVSVYGGCLFDGEPDRRYRTVIDADTGSHSATPAVSADGVNSATAFDSIVVMGTEQLPNTASIAMAVSNSKGLTLARLVLVAGKVFGSGTAVPPTAPIAQNGGGGDTRFFTPPGGQGPGGPSCAPDGVAGRGGDGAARRTNTLSDCSVLSCDCIESGGLRGSNGSATGSIPGGAGGASGTQGYACYERPVIRRGTGGQGDIGGPGSVGNCALRGGVHSADVWGSFQGTSWLPGAGGAGGNGDVGSGGGGGGPGGMCTGTTLNTNEWFPYWGQPGGGGGAGGCGGRGSPGGTQGGASIGLVLASSTVTLEAGSMAIVGNQGGFGVYGGPGGLGGAGGTGGAGGNSGSNCTAYFSNVNIGWGGLGGLGGNGGQGGPGGGSAGGNGGPSIGIALVDGSSISNRALIYSGFAGVPGGPGPGGRGGADGCTAANGEQGVSGGVAEVFDAQHPPR